MRALAEFVMRGRAQATGVGVLCAVLPFLHWVSAAVVGLVVLRRGAFEGSLVMLWTLLPLVVWYQFSSNSSTLLMLLGAFVLAWILRVTVSWELTLVAAVPVSVVASLIFEVSSPDVLGVVVDWYMELSAAMKQQLDPEVAKRVLVGFFSMGQAFAMILMLVLARWWQSVLYNPGGFQTEFHQMRLPAPLGAALVAVMMLLFLVDDPAFGRWIPLMTVPMLLPAVALVHWTVKDRKMSANWLVTFYLLLLFMVQLIYPLLATLALLDSGIGFRQKFGKQDRSDKPDDEV